MKPIFLSIIMCLFLVFQGNAQDSTIVKKPKTETELTLNTEKITHFQNTIPKIERFLGINQKKNIIKTLINPE